MKINGYKKEFVMVVTYRIEEVPEIGTVMYSDYYDDNDKIIDSIMRTEDGYAIEVPSVLEDIQNFIDTEISSIIDTLKDQGIDISMFDILEALEDYFPEVTTSV